MSDENCNETLVEKEVNYILELEDRIIVVENVPATCLSTAAPSRPYGNISTQLNCILKTTCSRL